MTLLARECSVEIWGTKGESEVKLRREGEEKNDWARAEKRERRKRNDAKE
jgi:hypothetical protein